MSADSTASSQGSWWHGGFDIAGYSHSQTTKHRLLSDWGPSISPWIKKTYSWLFFGGVTRKVRLEPLQRSTKPKCNAVLVVWGSCRKVQAYIKGIPPCEKPSFKALRWLHVDVPQTIGYHVYQWIVSLSDVTGTNNIQSQFTNPSNGLSQLWPSPSKYSKLKMKVRLPCMNSMTLMRLDEVCTNMSNNCYHTFGNTTKTCQTSFWKPLTSNFTVEEFSKKNHHSKSPFFGSSQEMLPSRSRWWIHPTSWWLCPSVWWDDHPSFAYPWVKIQGRFVYVQSQGFGGLYLAGWDDSKPFIWNDPFLHPQVETIFASQVWDHMKSCSKWMGKHGWIFRI